VGFFLRHDVGAAQLRNRRETFKVTFRTLGWPCGKASPPRGFVPLRIIHHRTIHSWMTPLTSARSHMPRRLRRSRALRCRTACIAMTALRHDVIRRTQHLTERIARWSNFDQSQRFIGSNSFCQLFVLGFVF